MPWVWIGRIVAGIFTGLGVIALIPPAEEEVVEPVIDTVATTDTSLMSYIALVGLLTLVTYLIFSFFRKK